MMTDTMSDQLAHNTQTVFAQYAFYGS